VYRDAVREQIQSELTQADFARSQGFEGRARVNARRAAGTAIQSYLEWMGVPVPRLGALDLIKTLGNQPGLPEEIQHITEHLLARVDEGFNLPIQVDLLQETRWLVTQLELLADSQEK
jgi:hypothetical protein